MDSRQGASGQLVQLHFKWRLRPPECNRRFYRLYFTKLYRCPGGLCIEAHLALRNSRPPSVEKSEGKTCLVQVDTELQQLIAVLPDLTVRLDRIKAGLLVKLLTSQGRVAHNLLALRRCLPEANAADLVLRYPGLLTEMTADDIASQVDALRCAPRRFYTVFIRCGQGCTFRVCYLLARIRSKQSGKATDSWGKVAKCEAVGVERGRCCSHWCAA